MEALDREEDDNLGPGDHLQRVLGHERSGRVRCRPGKNIAPTKYWITSPASHIPSTSELAAHAEAARARSQAEETIKVLMEERDRHKRANEELIKALSVITPSLPTDHAAMFDSCLSNMRSIYEPPSTSGGQHDEGDGGDDIDGNDRGDDGGDDDDGVDGSLDGDDDSAGDSGDDDGDDIEGDMDPLHY